MPGSTRLRAFVIMPFSTTFATVFHDVIRPALVETYDVIRADSHLNQQNILKSIAEGIAAADLIIADVTATNPNVMYELGAAHALGKPTVMISQSSASLPFDLRSYPVQLYDPSAPKGGLFGQHLREIATRHAAGELRFGNPIADFLPGTGTAAVQSTLPAAASPDELESDYGQLDFSVDMQEYGTQLLAQFARLGELNSQLTQDIRGLGPPIQRARSAGDTKLERSLTNDLAGLVLRYSGAVRTDVLPAFHEGWVRVGHAMQWMAAQKPEATTESDIADFCGQMHGLRNTLTSMIGTVVDVRESILIGRGRTGQLDRAIREMESVFNDFIGEVMIADAILARVQERLGCSSSVSG